LIEVLKIFTDKMKKSKPCQEILTTQPYNIKLYCAYNTLS
jgi:hypothetical protein